MNINNDNQVHIANLYQSVGDSPTKITTLNQEERKLVMFALKSINGHDTPQLSDIQKFQMDQIRAKLRTSTSTVQSSNFIKSAIKGFLNLIKARVSSEQIRQAFADTKAQISQDEQSIPDRIKAKEANIQDWKELLEFNPKAAGHYRDLSSFLKTLPQKMEDAVPLLKEKITEIEERVLPKVIEEFKKEFRSKNNGKEPTEAEIKGGLVKVVRDEVLASLKNMVEYPESRPKLLLRNYKSQLIREALDQQGVDIKKELKRDISQLPIEVQKDIKQKVAEKEAELQTEKGKADIRLGFENDMKLQIKAYDVSANVAGDPLIPKRAENDIQKLQGEIEELQQRQQKITPIVKKTS